MSNTKIILEYVAIIVVIALISYIAFSIIVPKTYSINLKAALVNNQTFYPYSIATYRIFVNNTGPNYIKNLTVGVYINNKTINNYYVSLPANKGAIINVSYEFPVNGNYIFTATADPAELINVENRANTTDSVAVRVNAAEEPSIYSNIPNNNILETKSFNLQQDGLYLNLYLFNKYNLTSVNMFGAGIDSKIIFPLFYSLLNYVASVNGAYAKYENGTIIYSLWLQGPLNTTSISTLLNKLNESAINKNGVMYTKLSNTSSLCAKYDSGWTKVIIGENQSGFNCSNLEKNYSSIESNTLVAELKVHKELIDLQTKLEYNNSTTIGSVLFSSSNSIGIANESANKYGFFLGYIQHQMPSQNSTMPCNGVVSNSTNYSICSVVIPEVVAPLNYSYMLINSSEIKGNYLISFYSLVNRTLAPNAEEGSVGIISSLNISGKPVYWQSTIFKNSCSSGTNSIACNVIGTGKNFSVNIKIKNLNNSTIHLNSIACYLSGFEKNTTIDTTLAANASSNITTECRGGTLSYINPSIQYNLTINYTLNNKVYISNGILGLS